MNTLKMNVFWDVAPCSLVEIDWRFRDAYRLHRQGVNTSETSVGLCETTRRNIPEDGHIHIRHRENLQSHIVDIVVGEICR
jgi:hypothetical protein